MGQPETPRSLRTVLLVNLGFLTSAALLLVGLTVALIQDGDPRSTAWALVALWLGTIVVFVLFVGYLVRRYILRPVVALAMAADDIAGGEVSRQIPLFDTTEFRLLAERFRFMADQLLDAQSQVVRAEKLAGLGRLAAGVAHEVRNPLGAIGNYVEVLRLRGADAPVIAEIQREIMRVDRIVQGLLEYSRPGPATGRTDLNATVQGTVDFLTAQGALKGHTVWVHIDSKALPTAGDEHALGQVVVNLLLNACDAVHPSGGHIEIGTLLTAFEPRPGPVPRRTDPDDYEPPRIAPGGRATRPWRRELPTGTRGVLLYVADDGPGVPEEDRERVFDPFYTTKDPGKGTGLGLAIVARSVYEAGGVVWVDRAREGGAVFKLFLPLADGTDATADR